MPRFFACGFSCNARPPWSRSAGSMRRASLRASSRVSQLAIWLNGMLSCYLRFWRGAAPCYRRAVAMPEMRPRGGQDGYVACYIGSRCLFVGSRSLQDDPRGVQDGPRGPQDNPRGIQDGPRSLQENLPGRFWEATWKQVGVLIATYVKIA